MAKRSKSSHRRGPRGTSYKMLAFAGLAGIGALVGAHFLETKVDYIRQHWYAGPAVLAVGGLVLARRMPVIGIALVAAAGLLGYSGYQANKEKSQEVAQGSAGRLMGAGYGGFRQGSRFTVARDSGLFDSGALMGSAARPLIQQQAGALMGPAASQLFQEQGAGALYNANTYRPIEGG